MSELVITSKDELEKMMRNIFSQITKSSSLLLETENEERMTQTQCASWLGLSVQTLWRWRRLGLVPFEKLPGSSKVYFYKSQIKAVLQQNPQLLQLPRK